MSRARQTRAFVRAMALAVVAAGVAAATAGASGGMQPGIQGLTRLFANHDVVAVAESQHAVGRAWDFYQTLVGDPGFQAVHPVVVIEFASRQSQALLDRYVVAGGTVAPETLRTIWRNTTKAASWEPSVYARWLAAMRAVNQALPPARRLRVLAGDTAIDWTRLHAPADWTALGPNDVSFAAVIRREVRAGRKVFVVLGSNHLTRGGGRGGAPNTTTRLAGVRLSVVYLYDRPGGPDADARIAREGWPQPALVPLHGSWAGAIPAGAARLEDLADALLYVGPSTTLTVEPTSITDIDPAYAAELDRRSYIEWGDSTRARRFLGLPSR